MSSIRGAIAVVVCGLLLLVVSLLWPHLVSDDQIWTQNQALEHAQASANLHLMTHEAAEAQLDEKLNDAAKQRASAELKAAQERYQLSRTALSHAQRKRNTAAVVMRWMAVGLVVAGLVAYMALRSDDTG